MTTIKSSLVALSLGIGASAAFAAPLANGSFANGLNGWTAVGDAIATGTPSAMLTTAFSDGGDDAINLNLSGNSSVLANQVGGLEELAGLDFGALDFGGDFAFEGSALTQSFSVNAGDVLSFNFSFLTNEDRTAALFNNDGAFVSINGVGTLLSNVLSTNAVNGLGPFSFGNDGSFTFTFTQSGMVNLAIGVFDTNDSAVSSALTVSNVSVTPAVPEPTSIALLLAGLAVASVVQRRSRR